MKRIAVVGGGISGLTAAFALEKQRQAGAPLEYVVFESSRRLGGVLLTEQVDGCQIEAGPDSFLTEKPWASDLCREIGLEEQLVGSNDADRKTYIVVKNKLIVIPDGLMFMVPTKIMPTVFSSLFSLRTKLRMAREWFLPPAPGGEDETVASLVERHYGAEMVDRLADPLLSGVYGGAASQLSVRAVLPRFAEMEAKHGSLGRGMISARRGLPRVAGGGARPLFTSLSGGMQQMADGLATRIAPASIHFGSPVESLHRKADRWSIRSGTEENFFDAVILAAPAVAAGQILKAASSSLASELSGIQYTSSVTVNLGYGREIRAALPPGFGFLVPRNEGRHLMAVTFVHTKFPHRAPENRALLRCFIGGSKNEGALQRVDREIISLVRAELREIVGLTAEPLFTRVYRWPGAMAQYGVGHLERLERIENLVNEFPGLALAGNGYRGIGVPDCVRSGSEAARRALASVGLAVEKPQMAS